jgi:lysophospholipase L1-like esterase
MTRARRVYALSALVFISFLLAAGLLFWRKPGDFLSSESDYYVADDVAGHLHRPYAKREYAWAEHEKGRIVFRTNGLGFREDDEVGAAKPDRTVRVLVTGDSHTDGVVYNDESFPNLLERRLNSAPGAPGFEVINGGAGYYTFQNYAGFLRKFLHLRPDYFIVTVYTGNDFMEAVAVAARSGQVAPQGTPFWDRLKLRTAPAPVVSQALNQIIFFKSSPRMKEAALAAAQRQLQEINELCLRHRVRFIVLLLPAKWDVEDRGYFQEEKRRFGLTEAEANLNQELKGALAGWLEGQGVRRLDLTDHMRGRGAALFWERDHHLNVRGHQLVADALYGSGEFTQKESAPAHGP